MQVKLNNYTWKNETRCLPLALYKTLFRMDQETQNHQIY